MYSSTAHQGLESVFSSQVDGLLYDLSMAKKDGSAQTGMGLPVHRQSIGRVSKPSSAGSSPQDAQRRRTSASSNRMSRFRPGLYQQTFGTLHDNATTRQRRSAPSAHSRARPMSWHPSTATSKGPATCYPRPESMYQDIAMSTRSTPMAQPGYLSGVPTNSQIPAYNSNMYHGTIQQMHGWENTQPQDSRINGACQNQPSMYQDYSNDVPSLAPCNAYPMFPEETMQYQPWNYTVSQTATSTVASTPDFLPIQRPQDMVLGSEYSMLEASELMQLPHSPQPHRKGSKELIGLGLYDKPLSSSLNRLGAGTLPYGLSQTVTGQGLKLEETWEPPEDDDESDDECDADGSDDDEGEEMSTESWPSAENEPPTGSVPTHSPQAMVGQSQNIKPNTYVESGDATETFRQLYGNMSDQSFFFESCDDNYAGMDVGQLTRRIAADGQGPILVEGVSMWG